MVDRRIVPLDVRHFVCSNGPDETVWHVARKVEIIGPVTGKVLSTHFEPKCGTRLGNCWGKTTIASDPPRTVFSRVCSKCIYHHGAGDFADGAWPQTKEGA